MLSHSAFITRCLALAFALHIASEVGAQTPGASSGPSAAGAVSQGDALKVFLDCQDDGYGCRLDFFVLELPFANWTRDRQFADVHVLVSRLQTGGGGTEYTLSFLGQGRFAGRADTLVITTPPAATEDEVRRALAQELRVGLLPYAVRTPLRDRFRVTYAAPPAAPVSAKALRDRWNLWTFEMSLNGNISGEQRQEFYYLFYSAEARRITDRWKVSLGGDGSYNQSRFTLQDAKGADLRFVNIQRAGNLGGRMTRSLDARWSAGFVGRVGQSDFYNQSLVATAAPVIEYNVFPWSEATRKQLTMSYAVGGVAFRYRERSLFGRDRETRPMHVASAALNTRLKWGSMNLRSRFSQFLDDPAKSNLSAGGGVNLRLVKGLSLDLFGDVAKVRDQVYLRAGGLSNEEVLVRQRSLATNIRYSGYVGVSYTFGSIFNAVVNPRLDNFRIVRF